MLINCGLLTIYIIFLFAYPRLISGQEHTSSGTYTVKEGDSLWNISEKLFQDGYQWQTLWGANKFITNPDKIVPGQQLNIPNPNPALFRGPDLFSQSKVIGKSDKPSNQASEQILNEEQLPIVDQNQIKQVIEKVNEQKIVSERKTKLNLDKVPAAQVPVNTDLSELKISTEPVKPPTSQKSLPTVHPSTPAVSTTESAMMYGGIAEPKRKPDVTANEPIPLRYITAESFVVPKDWKYDGIITGGEGKKILLSTRDTVYLNFGKKQGVKSKSRCFVYRRGELVKHPTSAEILGMVVIRIGLIEITTHIEEQISTGQVISCSEPLEVGDLVRIIQP